MPKKQSSEPSEAPETPPVKVDHVKEIYSALSGQPVLLRVREGKKGPVDRGWDQTTWEDTLDEGYREDLGRGNIGVLLGRRSALRVAGEVYHLCSIDIDDDADVEPFLELNPRLRQTLMTKGKRGGNLWVWALRDSYPAMHYLKKTGENGEPDRDQPWGEWRTDGVNEEGEERAFQTVIYGTHPDGMRYQRISKHKSPIRMDFEEIEWPEELFLPWAKSDWDQLVDDHGEPWTKSKKGAFTLNPPFWVGLYATQRTILYEPEEGRFYDYQDDRGLWVNESEDSVRWKYSLDMKKASDDAKEPALLGKRTNTFLQGLTSLLKGCVEKREAFKREPGLVHLQNGMLDLRNDPPTLSSFEPRFHSRNQIPVDLVEGADCPVFRKELLEAALPPGDVSLIQRWAGQLLLGVNLTQKIMLLVGKEGRGKSTLMNVIKSMIGMSNIAGLRTEHLHQRFELFNYIGKTFLIGADVPGKFLMTEGAHVLKALVGKDVLTAEKKNGDSVNIIGDFNIGLTSNSRLKVKLDGDAGAYGRRLMIINYERPKPERPDPHFEERLIASEASGILNWMIEGAMILLEEIRTTGSIIMNAEQKDRVESLLAESDSLRQFVTKVVTISEGDDVTSQELSIAYVQYCEARGWNPLPTKRVESAMPDAMTEIHRVAKRNDIKRDDGHHAQKAQRGYRGIKILVTEDPEEGFSDV